MPGARGIVMRAIDKLDRLGEAGVRALLGAGRRDESGDFTAAPGSGDEQAARDPRLHDARRERRRARPARDSRELVGGIGGRARGGARSSRRSPSCCERAAARPAVIDPSVVRGLGYYTGPVFEAELTFEVVGDDGRPRQFGSVAGGGRYDDLVQRFTGEAVPATGVSIGVDRLLAALGEKGRLTAVEAGAGGGDGDGSRPDGRLPGDGGGAARGAGSAPRCSSAAATWRGSSSMPTSAARRSR